MTNLFDELNDEKITFVISPKGYGKCYKEYKNVIDYLEDKINKLENENQQLKKQKDDVVEYIKKNLIVESILDGKKTYVLNNYTFDYEDLLRMLGEEE